MANMSNRGDAQTSQARDQAEAAKGHLQQAGSEAKQAASSAASGLAQKAQETASNLTERAKDAASNVSQRAGEMAQRAEDRTDDALSSMGHRMSTMAGSLRQTAPREGVIGSAAGAVADRLDRGGRYLQEHGVSDITDDLTGVIRRNPLPALCAAFGVGLLIGIAASRR
jgi:cell division septum initiation protein DivIVA